MAENEKCTHDCSSCSANCKDRNAKNQDFSARLNEMSRVKKVIGVVSGKGGVGKSIVTSMLAVLLNRRNFRTAILDADVTGPSIPKAFGIHEKATGNESFLFPVRSRTGVEVMSVNLLLQEDTAPVVWRGPVIAGTVKQFWTDVVWADIDFMFVDMPPGTGDVPLTVFQSLPVDGIIMVTSPQELVSMIVSKAVRMAELMHIPVLGLVENMSYVTCPDCGKQFSVFGDSHAEEVAASFGLPLLAKIPMDPRLASACDQGMIELFEGDFLNAAADKIEALLEGK